MRHPLKVNDTCFYHRLPLLQNVAIMHPQTLRKYTQIVNLFIAQVFANPIHDLKITHFYSNIEQFYKQYTH